MSRSALKVVTFNVFHDYPHLRYVHERLEILEQGLSQHQPDVVILQEVSVSQTHGDLGKRLVEALRERGLHYDLHYAPANGSVARGDVFEEGSAILSRLPIHDSATRELAADNPVEREAHGYRFVEHRIAVAATLLGPDGSEIEVIGTHVTDAGPEPRRRQIEDLTRFARERAGEGLVLLGGDFNARPDAEEIECLLASGFVDLGDAGPTNDPEDRDLEHPHETASHRIDYIFRRGESAFPTCSTELFLARPVQVEPGRWLWASDHNGILARLG